MRFFLILLFLLSSCSGKSEGIFSKEESDKVILDFSDPANINQHYQRGKYLVSTIGACGHCHGANLSGGNKLNIAAPNITSDPVSGIGKWRVNDLVQVLKGGKKDKSISTDVHQGLSWMSDNDARSIAIYLLGSSPIESGPTDRKSNSLDIFSAHPNVKGYVLHPKENANASYGRYLAVNIASCQTCHGEGFEGSENGPKLKKKVAKWSKEQIVNYLKTGSRPDGKKIHPSKCPWGYYRLSNSSDQQAIAFFIRTLL